MNHLVESASSPFGLVALALLLLFSLIPASPRARRSRWLIAVCIAGVSTIIVGGLVYAFLHPQVEPTEKEPLQSSTTIQQKTGDRSPAVAGAKGDVTIIINEVGKKK
jgi:NhaP-type Na+/H+ or K+/H+ antiporter